jgi:hypothetical protein
VAGLAELIFRGDIASPILQDFLRPNFDSLAAIAAYQVMVVR